MKKTISLLLCLAIVVSLSVTAFAEAPKENVALPQNSIRWYTNDAVNLRENMSIYAAIICTLDPNTTVNMVTRYAGTSADGLDWSYVWVNYHGEVKYGYIAAKYLSSEYEAG